MFKKILLAADGSEHSLRAAEKAIELAKVNENSQVIVVYVIDSSRAKSDVLQNWNSLGVADDRRDRIKEIEQLAKKHNISYDVKLLRGEPGPTIVKFANTEKVDVIVVGSRGLNSLQEMVLGSVSHKIAKRANSPVMIVK